MAGTSKSVTEKAYQPHVGTPNLTRNIDSVHPSSQSLPSDKGAVHSVVFGGFAATELAARLHHAQPKAVITATCGIEKGHVLPYLPIIGKAIGMLEACMCAAPLLPRKNLLLLFLFRSVLRPDQWLTQQGLLNPAQVLIWKHERRVLCKQCL